MKIINYKVEWSYEGQNTYHSFANRENLNESLNFVQRLRKNQTDYNYNEINAVRIELNEFLWISIRKYDNNERYFLMCTDYEMGVLNTFHDIEILIKEFHI